MSSGRRVVIVEGVVLVVPAQAEIEFETFGDLPIVLDVEAVDGVIDIGGIRRRTDADADRDIRVAVDFRPAIDVEQKHWVSAEQLLDIVVVERDAAADLEGVAVDFVEGQVIAQRERALADVLVVATAAETDHGGVLRVRVELKPCRDGVGVAEDDMVLAEIVEVQGARVVVAFEIVDLRLVEPALAAPLVAQVDLGFIDVERVRALRRILAADVSNILLAADRSTQIEQVIVVRLPAQLAEPKIFLERRADDAFNAWELRFVAGAAQRDDAEASLLACLRN